jgi:hypothetical protein
MFITQPLAGLNRENTILILESRRNFRKIETTRNNNFNGEKLIRILQHLPQVGA